MACMPTPSAPSATRYDCIIIGGGLSGLAAAASLTAGTGEAHLGTGAAPGKRVALAEARKRLGGRVCMTRLGNFTVNVGAAWLHGTDGNCLVDLVPADMQHPLHRSAPRERGACSCTEPCSDDCARSHMNPWLHPGTDVCRFVDVCARRCVGDEEAAGALRAYYARRRSIPWNESDSRSIYQFCREHAAEMHPVEHAAWGLAACWMGGDANEVVLQDIAGLDGALHLFHEQYPAPNAVAVCAGLCGDFPGPHVLVTGVVTSPPEDGGTDGSIQHPIVSSLESRITASGLCTIMLDAPVQKLHISAADAEPIRVETPQGSICSNHVILTVPVSVLNRSIQCGDPAFSDLKGMPESKLSALGRLRLSTYVKIFLVFDRKLPFPPFLVPLDEHSAPGKGVHVSVVENHTALISGDVGSTTLLCGVVHGADAYDASGTLYAKDVLISAVVKVVEAACMAVELPVPPPTEAFVTTWESDPWALGAYAYPHPDMEDDDSAEYQALWQASSCSTLHSAGDATDAEHLGSMYAAFSSGQRAASEVP